MERKSIILFVYYVYTAAATQCRKIIYILYKNWNKNLEFSNWITNICNYLWRGRNPTMEPGGMYFDKGYAGSRGQIFESSSGLRSRWSVGDVKKILSCALAHHLLPTRVTTCDKNIYPGALFVMYLNAGFVLSQEWISRGRVSRLNCSAAMTGRTRRRGAKSWKESHWLGTQVPTHCFNTFSSGLMVLKYN